MHRLAKSCPCDESSAGSIRIHTVAPAAKQEENGVCPRCSMDQPAPEPPVPADTPQSSPTRAVYRIVNMDCPTEEALIRKKLGTLSGINRLEFNLMQRLLVVEHERSSTAGIEAALRAIGMYPEPVESVQTAERASSAVTAPWARLSVGGLAAALAEIFDLLHAWDLTFLGVNPASWHPGGVVPSAWLPLVLALIAIAAVGLGTYKKGWIALRSLNLNINALMSVAVSGAILIGQYAEAAMVMVLFNLSEAMETRTLDRARKAMKDLLALAPERATVLATDGTWREMDSREVGLASLVRVRPGERVPLDGVIVSGASAVNQAPITGESMPVEKKPGDTVYAGSINEYGSFEFEVSAAAGDTTLARIMHAVEEAQASRAPVQRLVDQFAQYYTPAVFLAAVLTGLVPPVFWGSNWGESIYTALVLLVIGCPCALVLSTPVTLMSGITAAARHGILVKGGIFLEQGRRMKWLALDKTGTITRGKPSQTDFVVLGCMTAAACAARAASLASRSDHPVSRAIAAAGRANRVPLLPLAEFAALPGQGVSGLIGDEKWYLGNLGLVQNLRLSSPGLEEQITPLEEQGKTVVVLVGPQGAEALYAVADTVKASSIEAVSELKKLGIRTIMLTGDNEHCARVIARQVGVDAYQAGLLPEDKLQAVAQLGRQGLVGMAGDGINDAPALARAGIGFAMAGGGTDTAMETADVALMDDDLRKIPRFIGLSRSTCAILLQNVILAIGVKAFFFMLTFMGLATMWMAVFADAGTSLLVVANGLRVMHK